MVSTVSLDYDIDGSSLLLYQHQIAKPTKIGKRPRNLSDGGGSPSTIEKYPKLSTLVVVDY